MQHALHSFSLSRSLPLSLSQEQGAGVQQALHSFSLSPFLPVSLSASLSLSRAGRRSATRPTRVRAPLRYTSVSKETQYMAKEA